MKRVEDDVPRGMADKSKNVLDVSPHKTQLQLFSSPLGTRRRACRCTVRTSVRLSGTLHSGVVSSPRESMCFRHLCSSVWGRAPKCGCALQELVLRKCIRPECDARLNAVATCCCQSLALLLLWPTSSVGREMRPITCGGWKASCKCAVRESAQALSDACDRGKHASVRDCLRTPVST